MPVIKKINNPRGRKPKDRTASLLITRWLRTVAFGFLIVSGTVMIFTTLLSSSSSSQNAKIVGEQRPSLRTVVDDAENVASSERRREEVPAVQQQRRRPPHEHGHVDRYGYDDEKKRGGRKTNDVDDETGSVVADTVTLSTSQGDVVVRLRPDLAPDSVAYVRTLATKTETPCRACRFYRAEPRGILQGVLKKGGVPPNKVLGACPDADRERLASTTRANKKCHGPVMTRGMVGWAAGGGGPDFFIDYYANPAKWWGNDHTVWGEIVDEESLRIVDSFFDLPAKKGSAGLRYLNEQVSIELKI